MHHCVTLKVEPIFRLTSHPLAAPKKPCPNEKIKELLRVSIIDDKKNSSWLVGKNFGLPDPTDSKIANELISLSREWTSLCIANIGVSSSLAFVGNAYVEDYITKSLIPFLKDVSIGREEVHDEVDEKVTYSFIIDQQDAGVVSDRLETVGGLDHASNSASQSHLGAIISDFEFFILRIAVEFSKKNPQSFLDMDGQISIGEILSAGDIDAILSSRIDKRIRGEMRGSHHDILKWLHQTLRLGSFDEVEKSPYFRDFMEACQRRHLFTHNGGVVNELYLQKCKDFGIPEKELPKNGDKLTVTRKYLRRTCGRSYLLGLFIIHMAIQKLGADEREASLNELLGISHDLLRSGNTKLAARVVDFAEGAKKPITADLKMKLAINKALSKLHDPSLNEDQQNEGAAKVLDEYDWSVTTPIFDLALACIKREFFDVIPLAKKACEAGLSYESARTFFVFKEARVVEGFMECFPRKAIQIAP